MINKGSGRSFKESDSFVSRHNSATKLVEVKGDTNNDNKCAWNFSRLP